MRKNKIIRSYKYVSQIPRRVRKKLANGIAGAKAAVIVRQLMGKSIRSQVYEMITLHRDLGRLRPFDYYAYELYDDERYSFAEKQEFVSWLGMNLNRTLNDPEWTAVADDKLVSYGLFRGLDIPQPEIFAIYHPNGRTCGRIPSLASPQRMAEFLRTEMRYPFFGKPARDWRGGGASSVDAIDHDRDILLMTDGTEISVAEYVEQVPVALSAGHKLRSPRPAGYIFQARIIQHPLIDRLSGGRVSSLRLLVLLQPDGPRLFRVSWKLPVGKNITDHVIGTSGNIKCSIDPATGRVERVVQGLGPDGVQVYGLGAYGREIDVHPDTGERLMDVQLPYWDRTVAFCLHAAAAFPGIRYQSWDIVMGVDGPLVLELNHDGGILQVPGCRGLNDKDLRRFLERGNQL